jgi:hypothetical protein
MRPGDRKGRGPAENGALQEDSHVNQGTRGRLPGCRTARPKCCSDSSAQGAEVPLFRLDIRQSSEVLANSIAAWYSPVFQGNFGLFGVAPGSSPEPKVIGSNPIRDTARKRHTYSSGRTSRLLPPTTTKRCLVPGLVPDLPDHRGAYGRPRTPPAYLRPLATFVGIRRHRQEATRDRIATARRNPSRSPAAHLQTPSVATRRQRHPAGQGQHRTPGPLAERRHREVGGSRLPNQETLTRSYHAGHIQADVQRP